MAKKRIRKYRRKGRWSSNIKTLTDQQISTGTNRNFYATTQLCFNPVQNENSVSQQYTVKNIEVTFEIDYPSANLDIEGLTTYIMYLPQGMGVSYDFPQFHPEYIMAVRFLGSPSSEQDPNRNPLRVKTRLSRRLQTGDSIILLICGTNKNTQSGFTINFNGLVRWWTKAN